MPYRFETAMQIKKGVRVVLLDDSQPDNEVRRVYDFGGDVQDPDFIKMVKFETRAYRDNLNATQVVPDDISDVFRP